MFNLKHKFYKKVAKIVEQHVKELKHKNDILNGGEIADSVKIIGSTIHGNVSIGEGSLIDKCLIAGSNITIGRYSSINGPNTTIYNEINPVTIGNFCSIARNVDIQEWNHPVNKLSTSMIGGILGGKVVHEMESKGPITIGHDVWIGAQAVVLSGVTIGNGAIIGANAVVSNNIPAFAIAVGNPAKVVRYRFNERIIQQIKELEWWNWPIEKIRNSSGLFKEVITDGLKNLSLND